MHRSAVRTTNDKARPERPRPDFRESRDGRSTVEAGPVAVGINGAGAALVAAVVAAAVAAGGAWPRELPRVHGSRLLPDLCRRERFHAQPVQAQFDLLLDLLHGVSPDEGGNGVRRAWRPAAGSAALLPRPGWRTSRGTRRSAPASLVGHDLDAARDQRWRDRHARSVAAEAHPEGG